MRQLIRQIFKVRLAKKPKVSHARDMTFSERLKIAFDGRTVSNVARSSGVSRSQLHRLLNDQGDPPISPRYATVMALADELGVGYLWLRGETHGEEA